MKILLTGYSGFLGKTILEFFDGYNIVKLGRNKADIVADLAKDVPSNIPRVDVVIHAAGKAHSIPKNIAEEQAFYNVNVLGTAHLLKALETSQCIPQAFVFISSISVYGMETGININESNLLNASDAYGKSKIEAEELIRNWCLRNSVICTILRLPLLIGNDAPGNLGAMIKGIKRGFYLNIAGGKAKKSMVLASDVAGIIEKSARIGGTYNLTDGYHPCFSELANHIASQLKIKKPGNIPHLLAAVLAKVGDIIGPASPINSNKLKKIITDLTFDDSKAREILGWNPTRVLEGFKIK